MDHLWLPNASPPCTIWAFKRAYYAQSTIYTGLKCTIWAFKRAYYALSTIHTGLKCTIWVSTRAHYALPTRAYYALLTKAWSTAADTANLRGDHHA